MQVYCSRAESMQVVWPVMMFGQTDPGPKSSYCDNYYLYCVEIEDKEFIEDDSLFLHPEADKLKPLLAAVKNEFSLSEHKTRQIRLGHKNFDDYLSQDAQGAANLKSLEAAAILGFKGIKEYSEERGQTIYMMTGASCGDMKLVGHFVDGKIKSESIL